jgi:large subunit ribosomal protein L17
MRHKKAGKELGRNPSHRRAMLRNMVTSLFKHEQMETTDTKAKALRPVAERMITLAKRGDLHARRQALAYIQEKAVTHRLFDELKDRYLDRQGGYVRIIKKGTRKGDGADLSIIQLLPAEGGKKSAKKKAKKSKRSKAVSPQAKKKVEAKKDIEEAETETKETSSEAKKSAVGGKKRKADHKQKDASQKEEKS